MARKWSNLNLPGALHYVNGNFLDRIPVFTKPQFCTAFLDETPETQSQVAQQTNYLCTDAGSLPFDSQPEGRSHQGVHRSPESGFREGNSSSERLF